ncbi:alpha/beta hydrolase [Actinophytocola xinjiangensis]|uniref:Alpha/beta hydrolase n=1 Tax=Actinophytocola xinjiangensis TaxID=485602 RepID=A0A7Z0WRB3_9PSEU|nr:alpha/beta hydrolase [Actinophytocola xinjiangensis]OLF13865.1 alpha/beta hydrolase [Actinophytocola xinjiangensis]
MTVTPYAAESTLPLADGEIHVCQDGPADAPGVLLIHGTAASARSWEPMLPLLTGSHRVIRVDLLGCGRSSTPDGASYTVEDQTRRVAEALDLLGVESVVAVGHSSGSAVATALAERRPDLVTGIVVINFGPDMAAYTEKTAAIDPARWPHFTDDQLREAVRSGFAPGYRIPDDFLEQVRAMNLLVFGATTVGVRAYLDESGLVERLTALAQPLLVIFGAEDLRWSPSAAAEYRRVPGATVEMLAGLGHSPNLENPRRTAAPLLAFTRSLAAR